MPYPFRVFKESNASPYSRLLRTSVTRKLRDAFFAFSGSINLFGWFILDKTEPASTEADTPLFSFGLLDILIIPTLLDWLTLAVWHVDNRLIKYGVGFILGLIAVPLSLVRVILAAILAFNPLTLIIVGIVHAISQSGPGGGAELKQALPIRREDVCFWNAEQKQIEEVPDSLNSFNLYLNTQRHNNGQNISVLPTFFATKSEEKKEVRGFKVYAANKNNDASFTKKGFFYLPLFQKGTKNLNPPVYSLLKLNASRLTDGMETYIEVNENTRDKTIGEKVHACRSVLNLIK